MGAPIMPAGKLPGDDEWTTSTRSGPNGGNCVRARKLPNDDIAVGHTRAAEDEDPAFVYTRPEWDAFIKGVKDGEFDFA